MPLVEVTVFEDELSQAQAKELISGITDTVCAVTSEKLRQVTWVVIHEARSGNWGVGGNPLGLADVRRMSGG